MTITCRSGFSGPGGLPRIHGDIPQQPEHGGNPRGVDAVLRLFETEHPLDFRVHLQDGKGEKAQGSVRQRRRRVRGAFPIRRVQGQKLPFFIPLDAYPADVVGELRQPVGDPPVRPDLPFLPSSSFPLPLLSSFRIASQAVQGRRQMASVRPQARGEKQTRPDA